MSKFVSILLARIEELSGKLALVNLDLSENDAYINVLREENTELKEKLDLRTEECERIAEEAKEKSDRALVEMRALVDTYRSRLEQQEAASTTWQEKYAAEVLKTYNGDKGTFVRALCEKHGASRFEVIKEIRMVLNLGLKEAKELMEQHCPLVIEGGGKEDVSDDLRRATDRN